MVLVQTTNRYQLERDIESVTSNSANWLKERFKEVLESDKDASRKCDYLGYSILNLDAKLSLLEEEIKELRHLKEHLGSAKRRWVRRSCGNQSYCRRWRLSLFLVLGCWIHYCHHILSAQRVLDSKRSAW